MIKHPVVFAFIDSQNLNLGVRSLGWQLDFKRFNVFLKDKFRVSKVFLFLGFVNEYQEMYRRLRSYGYEIIFRPIVKTGRAAYKGNVDVELVIHALWYQFDNYDKAIVVSGDGDFYNLYKVLQQESKLFKILIPNYRNASSLLKPFSKYKYLLARNRKELEKVGGRRLKPRKLKVVSP